LTIRGEGGGKPARNSLYAKKVWRFEKSLGGEKDGDWNWRNTGKEKKTISKKSARGLSFRSGQLNTNLWESG